MNDNDCGRKAWCNRCIACLRPTESDSDQSNKGPHYDSHQKNPSKGYPPLKRSFLKSTGLPHISLGGEYLRSVWRPSSLWSRSRGKAPTIPEKDQYLWPLQSHFNPLFHLIVQVVMCHEQHLWRCSRVAPFLPLLHEDAICPTLSSGIPLRAKSSSKIWKHTLKLMSSLKQTLRSQSSLSSGPGLWLSTPNYFGRMPFVAIKFTTNTYSKKLFGRSTRLYPLYHAFILALERSCNHERPRATRHLPIPPSEWIELRRREAW